MKTGLEMLPRYRSNLGSLLVLLTVATILTGLGPGKALAQDAHYWTNQYGNRARLLGGATIGSSVDVSGVFYNPGRLTLQESFGLVVAGTAFRFASITLEDALGNGVDLTSSRVGGAPSLFAGEFRFKWLGDNRLAYSFFTRYDFNLRFEIFGDLTSLTSLPDADLFTATLNLNENLSEYWGGLTWSFPLGEKVGLGISGFGLVRDNRSRFQTVAQARVDDTGAIALQGRDFDYQYWGLLAKIGIGADLGDWSLGMTITTPNLRVKGSGRFGYSESLIDNGLGGDSTTHIISDFQKDLRADYDSPASVGIGAAYVWPTTSIHLAAEWFQKVDPYTVLETEPIAYPDSNATFTVDIADQRKSVINFGVGVEHDFKPHLSGYASFRTDFNAGVLDEKTRAPLTIWDIYHLAAGASFALAGSEFTLGAIYAFGNDTTKHGIDLVPDEESEDGDDPINLPTELKARYRELTFVLGFAVDF